MELVINEKRNKAYYLLPLTGILIRDEILSHLKNVYFADKHNLQYNNHLFLLFDTVDIIEEEIVLWVEKSPLFIDAYNYNKYVMCVFEYLPKWESDVKLYRLGKYSKTTPTFKETILQTLYGTDHKSKVLYNIFKASIKDRKALAERLDVDEIPDELWDKPDLSIEEFSISNYLEIIR